MTSIHTLGGVVVGGGVGVISGTQGGSSQEVTGLVNADEAIGRGVAGHVAFSTVKQFCCSAVVALGFA